jgi:hypothetical protein
MIMVVFCAFVGVQSIWAGGSSNAVKCTGEDDWDAGAASGKGRGERDRGDRK